MTPKQRYLFDLTGYIHLKNVLSDEELQNAQDAVERCVQTPQDELPPGISYGGGGYSNGFSLHSFSKTTGDPGIRFYLK